MDPVTTWPSAALDPATQELTNSRPLRREISLAPSVHLTRARSRGVNPAKLTKWRKPWQPGVTPFEEVLNADYEGEGTKENPYLIDWLENDKENPINLNEIYKWLIAVYVSLSTLAVALSSSAFTGAIPSLRADFPGKTTPEYTLGVSLFVLGFAIGPLLWAPLSELLGRRNVFLGTFFPLTLWTGVSIASPNLAALLVFRLLAGSFGSSPFTNAGGVLADIFTAKQRGLAMAVFACAPFLGPALGPICAGFIGEAGQWRWVFGFLTIFCGVITAIGYFFVPETYAPVLLRRRAHMLSKATGASYLPKMDKNKDVSFKTQFKVSLQRPWVLLFREHIVLLIAIYMSIIYGILYSLFAAFPIVFMVGRGWSLGISGLSFLGVAVGVILALIWMFVIENPRYVRKARAAGGVAPPEERLFTAMVGAPLLTIGLVWFAASDGPQTHWIVPIIGTVPFGMGMVFVFLCCQAYLVESYLVFSASVLSGNTAMRSMLGFAFPLFTPHMYQNLGVHWGASIPAFLSLVCLPIPFLFYRFGASIRERSPYSAEAMRLGQIMQHQQRAVAAAGEKHDSDIEKAAADGAIDEKSASGFHNNNGESVSSTPAAPTSVVSHVSSTEENA